MPYRIMKSYLSGIGVRPGASERRPEVTDENVVTAMLGYDSPRAVPVR